MTPSAKGRSGTDEVDDLLRQLVNPLKPEMEALRSIILGVHPEVREEVKWKSPSFRFSEHFATMNIRKDALLVILHLGAKVREAGAPMPVISDPSGLLEWLAKDRAAVRFPDMEAIRCGRPAFENILRQWIAFVR